MWPKPVKRPEVWSVEEFAALPETLTLRMIRLRVASPGFRTREVVLVTTLLDAQTYPSDALRDLYGERWNVELHFHQIKVSLAMDVLRCQSPEMIRREALLHGIAYNLIRCLMQRSAHLHRVASASASKALWIPCDNGPASSPPPTGSPASRINSLSRCSPPSPRPGPGTPRS